MLRHKEERSIAKLLSPHFCISAFAGDYQVDEISIATLPEYLIHSSPAGLSFAQPTATATASIISAQQQQQQLIRTAGYQVLLL